MPDVVDQVTLTYFPHWFLLPLYGPGAWVQAEEYVTFHFLSLERDRKRAMKKPLTPDFADIFSRLTNKEYTTEGYQPSRLNPAEMYDKALEGVRWVKYKEIGVS